MLTATLNIIRNRNNSANIPTTDNPGLDSVLANRQAKRREACNRFLNTQIAVTPFRGGAYREVMPHVWQIWGEEGEAFGGVPCQLVIRGTEIDAQLSVLACGLLELSDD